MSEDNNVIDFERRAAQVRALHTGYLLTELDCKPASKLDQISRRTGVELGPCMTREIPSESAGYIIPEWSTVDACCWSRFGAG